MGEGEEDGIESTEGGIITNSVATTTKSCPKREPGVGLEDFIPITALVEGPFP
jgi:hypothetical protein